MAYALRYNTASQEVPLGYFVDSGDGNSEETGLTINNTDIKLHKTGATTLANKNSGGATHISNGIYYAVLDATDTNTLGPLTIFIHVTGALPVRLECVVLPQNVYDALIAGSDYLDVDAYQVTSGAITAAAIATGAVDADALAADAGTEIADAILARDIGSGTGAGTLDERTVRSALRALRNKWGISGNTLTVKKEDDTTTAWTGTLTATSGASPITECDPA